MFTTSDAHTLYLHATMQLGRADAASHARGEHQLSSAERRQYETAIAALENVEDPLARGEALHAAIGALWNAPAWSDMQGPERAAYVSVAGVAATIDGVVPLPSGRPGADSPAARQAWDEAVRSHPHFSRRRKRNGKRAE